MFYGWVILLILCLNYLCVVGFNSYTFGAILVPMVRELGYSMTQVATAQMCSTLGFALISLVVGQLVGTKIRAKTVTVAATAAGIAAGAIMAAGDGSYPQFFLCYAVFINLTYFSGFGMTAQILLTNWFHARRNTALALLLTMGGIAGFFYPPFATLLTRHTGTWRSVWLLYSCTSAAACALSCFFLKERPADMGLEPYGAGREASSKRAREADYITKVSFTQAEAVRSPFFYVCILVYIGAVAGGTLVTTYLVSHLRNQGLPPLAAATGLSVFAFCNMWGRLASGVLQDRYDPGIIVKIVFPATGTLLILLPYVHTYAQMYAFSFLFGIGFSMTFSCPYSILMNTYGLEHYGQIYSIDYAGYTAINSIIALLPGIAYDRTGTYAAYFYAIAAIQFVTTALLFIVRPPHKSDSEIGIRDSEL